MKHLVLLLLLVVALPATSFAEDAAPTEKARDFTLKSVDGAQVSLGQFLGKKVVVLSFWATWCGPCLKEMPHLDKLQRDLGGEGLQVVSVSVDSAKDEAKAKTTVKRINYAGLTLLDPETKVVNDYNPRKDMPYTIVIGKDGMIHHRQKGFTEGDELALRALVTGLLAK